MIHPESAEGGGACRTRGNGLLTRMKRLRHVVLAAPWLLGIVSETAALERVAQPWRESVETGLVLDPEIRSIVSEVDAQRVAADMNTLVEFGSRNSCSDNSGASPGIGAARDWVRDQLLSLPGMNVSLNPFSQTGCSGIATRQNVIAWILGTGHPDRLIVIGGHYDSRTTIASDGVSPAPGANDSGSQAAAVIEVARVLAGRPYDATIVIAAWAGEEQGLVGSSAFVTNYRSVFPNGGLELNLTMDIVGGDNTANDASAPQQFRIFSPGTPREIAMVGEGTTDDTSPSRGVMRHIGVWGGAYVPSMTMIPKLREDRPNRGSDHKSFIRNSVPGVRFIEVNENLSHQHSPNDLLMFTTPAYTARIAQVVAAAAASLARASTPPRSMSAKLDSANIVKLAWTAPASGPAVDHYVISARPVTENLYRTRSFVPGSATVWRATLSEDLGIVPGSAFYVSVAAVDEVGHQSLYAYPEYRCSSSLCEVPFDSLDVTATK